MAVKHDVLRGKSLYEDRHEDLTLTLVGTSNKYFSEIGTADL